MSALALLWQLLRHFGARWLAYRLSYAASRRLGLLRYRLPNQPWRSLDQFVTDRALSSPNGYLDYRRETAPPFFFRPTARLQFRQYLNEWDRQGNSPLAVVQDLRHGEMRYFGHSSAHIGFPPRWHHNPFAGFDMASDQHWSEIEDFRNGDIKVIWEPSRFAFVFALVRAYWRTGDDSCAEMFWNLVEDWRKHNRPQQGANWMCGQETSLRVMAWVFGLYGFLESAATTGERVAMLAGMIATSGERIEANLGYALSQQNNHGISEATGLWTIGALFPEFAKARHWEERGRRLLEKQGRSLIYDDGAFSQHSLNYHRLMLHDYLWCLRLADVLERPFSDELRQRVGRAGTFLHSLQLGGQGEVPRYGQNDGALILPLNNCDHQDFRPVIQAVHYLATGTRLYPDGAWNEDLLWLFGESALSAPLQQPLQSDLSAEIGGYYTLNSPESAIFVRCGALHHRPSQADMLHVDVWWRGQNVALDPGTYSYNAPAPWNNPLADTYFHNTVTVDENSQMQRAGRFLWLPWVKGKVIEKSYSLGEHLAYWQGEHDGYLRLKAPVRLRRAIARLGAAHWLILDHLTSNSEHDYRLHWLLADLPYEWEEETHSLALHLAGSLYRVQVGALDAELAISVVRAEDGSPRGCYAPYYQERRPAISLAATVHARSTVFWTCFGPDVTVVVAAGSLIAVETATSRYTVELAENSDEILVKRITATHDVADILEPR